MNTSRHQSLRFADIREFGYYYCSASCDKRNLLGLIALLVFCFTFASHLIAQPLLILSPKGEKYALANYTSIFEDKTAHLTFNNITQPDFRGFLPLKGSSLSAGYTTSAYWLKFRVVVPTNDPLHWLLEVGYPNLHRLDLYIHRTGNIIVHKKAGALEPFEQKEWTSPVFVFSLSDSVTKKSVLPDTITCYLRVQTESAMIVPLTLYESHKFAQSTIIESLLYGVLYGVMLAMVCYNLFLWLTVRERFYLYYVFYVSMFIVGDVAIKGFGSVLTQSLQIHWVRILPHVMPLSSLGAVLFARSFLRPVDYSSLADKILLAAVAFHLIIVVLTFFIPYALIVPIIAIMIGVVSFILLATGILSLRSGYRPARFFVAGWSIFLTASLLRSFSTVGAYSFTWWADHMPIIGAAVETLLLSLALADRINLLKRQQAEVLERAVEERTAKLQEANDALEDANRFKTQMLSIAAHDLKNPLAQIMGFTQLAEIQLNDTDTVASLLRNVHHAAEEMLALVKNILDSASMELGKIQIVTEPFSLAYLLQDLCETYRYSASQKGQSISTEIEGELFIDGDGERLQQVFDNLLSNAVKYSPRGKKIWVRAHALNDTVRIEVQDEGPGLTEKDKTKLFGFFQRLSALPTGGESSNGVGLAIVKKIVDLHSGFIWVESEPQHGATFIVELPLKRNTIA